ncbi:MraY family glycosyltransferase [Oceanobacillus jeddahense]|uniref:Undecaprenyl/decaprenyl-phosphate alpha-N-acetylglucosaminyl 1-phosphate transferase n=1 Tax=Oceanobacillus jeddahense TaxID=1462527 RepID=A0ABY5JVD5_9BACI|nr:MraY family glycosyltransferase [Oceanobacillus jeddahense]UUI02544.1 undecaprenyl/decaprenyl-phosphate alpha-N-acetylglucosaminyl 1-phosphate transferase [Oceanobacillus jeddahense]
MWSAAELLIAFVIALLTAIITTPIIISVSKKLNLVDQPDHRKQHQKAVSSIGGLAIFFGIAAGFLYLQPEHPQMTAIVIGAMIMLLTGFLDDIFDLRPGTKLLGQVFAASVVAYSGLVIEKLTLPFMGTVFLGEYVGIALTIFWIVAAANAINLIDGLDGLAGGVSTIAFISILIMAIMDYRVIVIGLCVLLIGATLGFLAFNFHPAKIFMGDTGALFLGYSIAIISMLGLFKNVAFFSFVIPIIVIALPVFDTLLAIIRRINNRQGISVADRNHIHYLLLKNGYSHRQSVWIIYAFSMFFGAMGIVVNNAQLMTSLAIFCFVILGIHLFSIICGIRTSRGFVFFANRKDGMDKRRLK